MRNDQPPDGTGSGSAVHPAARFAAAVRSRGAELAGQPLTSLDAEGTVRLLHDLDTAIAQLQALRTAAVAHADRLELPQRAGATSVATWLAATTRTSRREAYACARLGEALEHHPRLHAAFAEGRLHQDQAHAILRALTDLPADLGSEVAERAERELVDLGRAHDAADLRVLGRRILEVAAPDLADAHEADLLERQEREAAATASLTLVDAGDGSCHGRFRMPSLHGAILRKALLAIAAPRHQRAGAHPDQAAPSAARPSAQRMGHALMELLETLPADRLPTSGGVSATVVVTMTLESLRGGLTAAGLDTGERLSAGEARRLACSAGIIPAVLGGPSQVLDLGRRRRFHTRSQRIALGLEQGRCRAEGCDHPPGLCHAHHRVRWADGGVTSVRDGVLLCPRHHALAHRGDYRTVQLPDGRVRFHRRT